MTRIAQCHCGQLKLSCEGEPYPVVQCHCELCQRRTGSPFQIGAWFEKENVTFEGDSSEFMRSTGDDGLSVTFNFCPVCGTSVWWLSPRPDGPLKGKVGIAGGCFADGDFPAPTISIYEKHRHAWVSVPEGIPCFAEGLEMDKFRGMIEDRA